MTGIAARVLHSGYASGELLVLQEGLSFWGGFDPNSGRIIDVHHPQFGVCAENKILVFPGSRGSAGTPAGIAEAVRQKTAPQGIILAKYDVNIAIGMMVAQKLYGTESPVVVLDDVKLYQSLNTGDSLTIHKDGTLSKD